MCDAATYSSSEKIVAIINKRFLGSKLFNIIGWLISMNSKDKEFLQSGNLLGFAGVFWFGLV